MVKVFGYEVRGVVILTDVGWGPQCTLDRGQKPLVVTRRQQQVVQDLLVRLALLETATQRTVGAFGRNLASSRRGSGAFPARELPADRLPYLDTSKVVSLDHGVERRISEYNPRFDQLMHFDQIS